MVEQTKTEITKKATAKKKIAVAVKPKTPRIPRAHVAAKKKVEPVATAVAEVVVKPVIKPAVKPIVTSDGSHAQLKYIYGVGGRKKASASAKMYLNGTGKVEINGRALDHYFREKAWRDIVVAPLKELGIADVDIIARVAGGGIRGQAEGVRLAIAHTILKYNVETKSVLRGKGYLTRDSRQKERKKYGLKKARRAPQWQKR